MLPGLDAAIRSCADPCSITVATFDYAQLVANLACSVHRFQRSLVVVAADSGLCAILAAVPGVHACVEPESPRLALPKDAYVLKLEVAARAASIEADAEWFERNAAAYAQHVSMPKPKQQRAEGVEGSAEAGGGGIGSGGRGEKRERDEGGDDAAASDAPPAKK